MRNGYRVCGVHGCIFVMLTGCVWCAWLYFCDGYMVLCCGWLYLCNGYMVCVVCMVILCNGYRVCGVHGSICVMVTGCV